MYPRLIPGLKIQAHIPEFELGQLSFTALCKKMLRRLSSVAIVSLSYITLCMRFGAFFSTTLILLPLQLVRVRAF